MHTFSSIIASFVFALLFVGLPASLYVSNQHDKYSSVIEFCTGTVWHEAWHEYRVKQCLNSSGVPWYLR